MDQPSIDYQINYLKERTDMSSIKNTHALTRGKLKIIYDGLSNAEKNQWASLSNYSSYQGLYRYLRTNQSEHAYTRVVQGLRATVGEEKFVFLIDSISPNTNSEISSEEEINIIEDLDQLTENILSSMDGSLSIQEFNIIEERLEKILILTRNLRQNMEIIKELNIFK